MILIVGILLLVVAVWFIIEFNNFIRGKNLIKEAWSGIDVQLKRRYDLVTSLVDAVKGYTKYERKILEDIITLRTKAINASGVKEREEKENIISHSIKTIFAVAEGYPQLKANRSFLNLQKNLSETEDQIQLARRYYNGAVRNYNIKVESFPSMVIANIFKFRQADFFEIEYATQRNVPEVKLRETT